MYAVTKDFVSDLGLDVRVEDIPPLHNLWMDCSKVGNYGVVFSDVSEGLLKCARDGGKL